MAHLPDQQNQYAGNGPPDPSDVSRPVLFTKLSSAERPGDRMPWVRKDSKGEPLGHLWIQILMQEELTLCMANAAQTTEAMLRSASKGPANDPAAKVNQEAWREIYEAHKATEALHLACRVEDDHDTKIFEAPSELRKLMTVDEQVMLCELYETVQRRYGPLWTLLSAEEIETWKQALAEGAETYPLASLSRGQLVQLITSLVFHERASKPATSLSGVPSSGSENATGGRGGSEVQDAPVATAPVEVTNEIK